MSNNWIVGNLQNAINTWNEKLSEIWQLISQTPENFRGGGIWNVIINIHETLQAIGLALLVLFFVIGIVKTCNDFNEVKKPEKIIKLFLRFAIAKAIVSYGLELMLGIFKIVQGISSTIMTSVGFANSSNTVIPQEIIKAIEGCRIF